MMHDKQHTLSGPVKIEGVGLHTGVPVRMTFLPAEPGHGFVFRRIDLEGKPEVAADVDNVVDTSRGTTIAKNGAKVHTVEHALAALAGVQIDNAMIEIDGPEPPAMDGSAIEFIRAIKAVGIEEQDAPREYFVVESPIHYYADDRKTDLAALPLDDFRVTVMIDYNSPVLGIQHATLVNISDFPEEVADSRTFCFLHELQQLAEAGLIKGGDLDNAIVLVDQEVKPEEMEKLSKLFNRPAIEAREGILNNVELRHRNEPARHKLLDLIGDLALVGAPIKGQILAARPGHSANVELAKLIKSQIKRKKIRNSIGDSQEEGVVFDINAITKILPHRYPFLLVDKITKFEDDHIEGIKNVTMNEPFFQGHFPGNPVMPGVLQLEAMAQVGGIMLINRMENFREWWVYFMAIDNARFKKPVIPGDTLLFKLDLLHLKRNICKMQGKGYVNGKLVCQADLTAALVKKDQ